MIESIATRNLGPVARCDCNRLASINLAIGQNGAGKAFVVKASYCMIRALADERGPELRSVDEIPAAKLYWRLPPDRLGDRVRDGTDEDLSFKSFAR